MATQRVLLYFGVCNLIGMIYSQSGCEIHQENSNFGYYSPNQILPKKVDDNNWLFASRDEIQKFYDDEKKKCLDYISKTELDNDMPPPHQFGGQQKCRGVSMLRREAGIVLWPFGPSSHCNATYSRCWIGVLSCGEPKIDHLKSSIHSELEEVIKKHGLNEKIPDSMSWSIKSVYTHIRVIGNEIIVPEQRYLKLKSNDGHEDVIIAQFTPTLPHDNTKIEMRLWELYPGVLYTWWSETAISEYGLDMLGNIFLGGSEDRCQPWTKCTTPNFCCGCDEKSFVPNTPIKLSISDTRRATCPNLYAKPLPLCSLEKHGTREPGRWIYHHSSAFAPNQCNINPKSILNIQIPVPLVDGAAVLEHKHYQPKHTNWSEFSGDPCLVRNYDSEDGGMVGNWAYAPYRCRYHVYRREELHKCLKDKSITHINFQGDSISRDLFGIITNYLGVKPVDPDELKKMTNVLKQKKIEYHSGDILVSEGNAWDFDQNILDMVHTPPVPQVVITNYAIAHRQSEFLRHFTSEFNKTEYNYWKRQHLKHTSYQKYLFFQNAKDLHGRKHGAWSAERIRRSSEILRKAFVDDLHFYELDEWIITAGRIDNYGDRNDGWHFWGSMRQMEAVIFFNMLCNDWLQKSGALSGDSLKNAKYP